VPAHEIDDYLAGLTEDRRAALEFLRQTILEIVPDAEQGLAYGVPAFRRDGRVLAGFAAAKRHLSYFPHSGWVLSQLADEVAAYDTSKGTLRFPVDTALPASLVRRLIEVRTSEIADGRTS
jgi:uncharacterized protein YdhG (YjbR/CyaY superfamily)